MEEKKYPLVSIISPVYNAKNYIRETIACVQNQELTDWELIFVEDGSTDGTGAYLSDYLKEYPDDRIKVYPVANSGAAAARNYGLTKATGRYIAYLDADDLWEPEKLAHQLAFMQKKDAAFCFTGYEFADETGHGLGKVVKVPETLTYRQALQNTTIFTSTVMFDTDKISKDDLNMPLVKSEDTALWFRILRQGYTAFGLDENLVKYRRSGNTLSSNKLEACRRIWNLYRKEEKLSVRDSMYNFFFWAIRAVKRRV